MGLAQGYWSLLAAILLLQFSANVSHGPLQGLIPDLAPEEQRGRASGVKGFFELLPLVLVALSVARLVGAGQIGWAVAVTGGVLLAAMLLTLVLVHEQPLATKPDTPLGPPMLRVLGVLAGIAAGAGAGLAAGAVMGGLAWLTAWPLAGWETAKVVGVGIGGLVAMGVAVVAGVWAGAWSALGQEARRRSSYTWWMVNRLMFFAAVTSVQGFAPYFLMHVLGVSREAAASLTGSLMAVVGLCTMTLGRARRPAQRMAGRPLRALGAGGCGRPAGRFGHLHAPGIPRNARPGDGLWGRGHRGAGRGALYHLELGPGRRPGAAPGGRALPGHLQLRRSRGGDDRPGDRRPIGRHPGPPPAGYGVHGDLCLLRHPVRVECCDAARSQTGDGIVTVHPTQGPSGACIAADQGP